MTFPGARRWFPVVAWAAVVANVGVILGGAIVRATGSGDGCGATWPRCTGQIIPTNPATETIIEFTHRVTSGLAILCVLAVVVLAFSGFPRRHLVRTAALASLGFMVIEALLGASLVLFGWVDQDASVGRMVVVPLHLTNTFLLLASLSVTAWWGTGHPRPRLRGRRQLGWLLLGAALIVVIGVSGALNALADTLYPADTVLGGVQAEFGSQAPFLIRLRVIHPLLAIAVGLGIAFLATNLAQGASRGTRRLSWAVAGLVVTQFFVGIMNVALLTPVESQVLHLACADALWITYVLFTVSLLGDVPARTVPTADSAAR